MNWYGRISRSLKLCKVEEIAESAANVVYSHYLQSKVVPFGVHKAMAELSNAVSMHFILHDSGDPDPEYEDWMPDSEPCAPPTDSWSRGVIPVREQDSPRDAPVVTPRLNPQTQTKEPDPALPVTTNDKKRKLLTGTKKLALKATKPKEQADKNASEVQIRT